jgi:HPt (histidine-containing phosphotransfer) domain-containing protein
MNDFLSKPIDRAALVQSLRRWLPAEAGRTDASPKAAAPASRPGLDQTTVPVLEGIDFLEGIDLPGAIRRLGIPFAKLQPVLLRFADSQPATLEALRGAVKAGESAAARKHAHALAGAAGNLGAEELRQSARALEFAASQGQGGLPELFGQVERCAGIVFRSIDSLRGPSGQREESTVKAAPPANPAEVRALLERLRSALVNGEVVDSSERFQELVSLNLSDSYRGPITQLKQFIDDYEYDKAAEAVAKFLADFSNGAIS